MSAKAARFVQLRYMYEHNVLSSTIGITTDDIELLVWIYATELIAGVY